MLRVLINSYGEEMSRMVYSRLILENYGKVFFLLDKKKNMEKFDDYRHNIFK
jgi:hypothetical protein